MSSSFYSFLRRYFVKWVARFSRRPVPSFPLHSELTFEERLTDLIPHQRIEERASARPREYAVSPFLALCVQLGGLHLGPGALAMFLIRVFWPTAKPSRTRNCKMRVACRSWRKIRSQFSHLDIRHYCLENFLHMGPESSPFLLQVYRAMPSCS